jgi:tungstate transport system ATP-binding protein
MTLLSVKRVEKAFGRRLILDGVDLSLVPGECQLLCGKNGAGKSTLLRILAGMERPDRASVTIGGRTGSWRQAKSRLLADCIYLHQQPYLFEGSVRYNLNYPLRGQGGMREMLVEEGLEWSGLTALADQAVHQLSGGERQRVALARAWLRHPGVMLLDEPTANMDVACRQRTVQLLQALKQEGLALLVTSHDPLHFANVADRMLTLADGRLNDGGPVLDGLPGEIAPMERRTRLSVCK